MRLRGLSFDDMPPLAVPFRFFVTAPLFAILVSLLLFFAEPGELYNRWSNLLLATTHGLTLGFMLMVMIGALFQILPVVLTVTLPKPQLLSKSIHFLLTIGITGLLAGFYFMQHTLLAIGGAAILLAIVIFFSGLLFCLHQMPNSNSSRAIGLAIMALGITVAFGLLFILAKFAPEWFANFRFWTNTHLLWGFIGWTFLLIMGVSFQIIPMFYVTADYPKWITWYLAPLIFLQLICFSLFQLEPLFRTIILSCLTITTAIYPIYTLKIIKQRRRKSQDMTIWFWNTAMLNYLIAAGLFLYLLFFYTANQTLLELIIITLILVGFVLTLITGMLLKIAPFLVWLNLQQSWIKNPSAKMPLTNMQQVIPNSQAKKQYYCFILMFAGLIMMLVFPDKNLIRIAALIMLSNFGYLFYLLIKAQRLYQELAKELANNNNARL